MENIATDPMEITAANRALSVATEENVDAMTKSIQS